MPEPGWFQVVTRTRVRGLGCDPASVTVQVVAGGLGVAAGALGAVVLVVSTVGPRLEQLGISVRCVVLSLGGYAIRICRVPDLCLVGPLAGLASRAARRGVVARLLEVLVFGVGLVAGLSADEDLICQRCGAGLLDGVHRILGIDRPGWVGGLGPTVLVAVL